MKRYFQSHLDEEKDKWDTRMSEMKQHLATIENEMIERQKKELETLHNNLETSLPTNFKPSSTLLNLKKVQQNLIKQKKYAEASATKDKIEEMEEEEDRKWKQVRGEKIAFQEAQLVQKHNREREGHNKRTKTALAELEIERDKNIQQFMQNYNIRKQIVNAQKSQVSKLKGDPIPGSKVADDDFTESSPIKDPQFYQPESLPSLIILIECIFI
eukprot:TRINITY_DN1592_c0_g1_i1.p4 TRINITY_DN1592_c0_g1~~TRINITY_DN1592_c0_g1_i1.p4  ORF type:complete len:214 (-),score=43.06 TRINITY_DN1592_c0_g1_i1:453-1094(-)